VGAIKNSFLFFTREFKRGRSPLLINYYPLSLEGEGQGEGEPKFKTGLRFLLYSLQ
jgi:hypothetical protein